MGRKSRVKRERRKETISIADIARQAIILMMADEHPIEEILSDPHLRKHLQAANILGVAHMWNQASASERERMLTFAQTMAEMIGEPTLS